MDSTVEAAKRTRRVLVLVVTASILGFAGLWNSRQDSWANARLARLRTMYSLWDTRPPINSNEEEIYRNLEFWRQSGYLTTKEDLLSKIHTLEAVRNDQLRVRVPFFGVEFDINDLGILAGMTFFSLLGWLCLSLYQESTNLELTFAKARSLDKTADGDVLRDCYQRLSMREVLTIPPRLTTLGNEEERKVHFWERAVHRFWTIVPAQLILMGLLIQITVWWWDLSTLSIGRSLNLRSYIFGLVMETIFLIFSTLMTVSCFFFARKLRRTWQRAAEELSGHSR